MKIFKIVVISSIFIGIIFIGVGIVSGATFSNVFNQAFDNVSYVLQDPLTYEEDIILLDVDVTTRNIVIEPSEDEYIHITYYQSDTEIWDIDLINQVLQIKLTNTNTWNSIFNWSFVSNATLTLTIQIPEAQVFDAIVKTNTGDIKLSDFQALEEVNLMTDTGRIEVKEISCDDLILESDTGDINVKNVIVNNDITIDESTGTVEINNATSDGLFIEVNTGSIYLDDVISNKIDLGTDTGTIKTTGLNLENRTLNLETEIGNVKVNGQSQGSEYHITHSNADFYLNANTDTGSIEIS